MTRTVLALLLLLFSSSCGDLDFDGKNGKRKVEVDPLYMVGIFDGTYKASAVKHQWDSNGNDNTFHYDNILAVFDQNGPSMTVLKSLNALPDRDSYSFRGNTFEVVWNPTFSYYSQVDYLGEGDRERAHVHLWGQSIDGAGVVFRTWEVDFDLNLGDRAPDFGGESFAGELAAPATWKMVTWEPDPEISQEEKVKD